MRKAAIIFAGCLTLSCTFAAAQNRSLDSIDRLIGKAASDTARINLQLKKISLLSNISLDSTIALAQLVVLEARKAGYEKGQAEAMTKLSSYYSITGDFEKAASQLAEAEKIYTTTGNMKGLSNHYNTAYGIYYGIRSQYDSAQIYFEKAIAIGESIHDSALLSSAWQNISIGYYMQSNFVQAIGYLQKALKYYEDRNDEDGQAEIMMNMGNAYTGAGDTARAHESFLRTIRHAKFSGNERALLYAYKNLATLLERRGQPDAVYSYAMKAYELAKKNGDQGIEAASLSAAALALSSKLQFNEAEQLNAKAIALVDSLAMPYNQYQAYVSMGLIFRRQDKYAGAISWFEKAFSKLTGTDIYDPDIASNYEELSYCYEKTGNFKKALQAYKVCSQITDSVRKQENVRKTTELSMTYDFDKRQQLAQLEQQESLAKKNAEKNMLVIGLWVTAILTLMAIVAYRQQQKANKKLNVQKEELQSTLSQLKLTQNQLIQVEKMASLGELTAGIAHEIQNPLNFVNNFSEINVELIAEMKDELKAGNFEAVHLLANDISDNEKKVNHHGKRADSIVKGMLQHSKSGTGKKEPASINELVDECLRLSYHGIRAKEKTFTTRLDVQLEKYEPVINIARQDIGRVLLNLFNNSFYSLMQKQKNNPGFQPEVSVQTEQREKGILIKVKDNGFGISQEIKDKIFQPFFTTKPTGEGTGLGLSISYDIITNGHGGSLVVDSVEGEYAIFSIFLPGK